MFSFRRWRNAAARAFLPLAAASFLATAMLLALRLLFLQVWCFGFDLLSLFHWSELYQLVVNGGLRFNTLRTWLFFPSLAVMLSLLVILPAIAASHIAGRLPDFVEGGSDDPVSADDSPSATLPAIAVPEAKPAPPKNRAALSPPEILSNGLHPALASEIATASKRIQERQQRLHGATSRDYLERARTSAHLLAEQLIAAERAQPEDRVQLKQTPAEQPAGDDESGPYREMGDDGKAEEYSRETDDSDELGYTDTAYGDSASTDLVAGVPTMDMKTDLLRLSNEAKDCLERMGYKCVQDVKFRSQTTDLVAIDGNRLICFALWPFTGLWDCSEEEDRYRFWIRDDGLRLGSPVDRVYREREIAVQLLSERLEIDRTIPLIAYPGSLSERPDWKNVGIAEIDPRNDLELQLSQLLGEPEGKADRNLLEELRAISDPESSPWT